MHIDTKASTKPAVGLKSACSTSSGGGDIAREVPAALFCRSGDVVRGAVAVGACICVAGSDILTTENLSQALGER